MAPTEGGFVRLDTITGDMSFCSKEASGWSCKPMNPAQARPDSDPGIPPPKPELQLPSEEEVDQAIDYLESMIRKFRERFEDFGEKTRPGRGPGPHDTPDTDTNPEGKSGSNGAPAPAPVPPPKSVPDTTPDAMPDNAPAPRSGSTL